MKWHWIVAVVALFFTASATASLEELAEALPSCALECFTQVLPKSSCAPIDQVCMCTDTDFTGQLETCVVTSCSIRQSLKCQSTACGAPVRDHTKMVSIAGLVGGALAVLAFALRMVARLPCCGGQLGMDDLTMALTMCCVIPLSGLSYILADDGLGKDMWTVPFDNITHILYVYFFDECLYLTAIALTKISILCFYLRVFPRLRGAWLHWDGAGHYNAAAINMVLDILVMALPLKELYQLNLSWRKKAFVMCMFSLGLFVTLVSVIRLESLITFAHTKNLTWDYVHIGYWSTIETHVGVICACLPAIRGLFRRIWPRIFGDTAHASSKAVERRSLGTGSRLEGSGLASPRLHPSASTHHHSHRSSNATVEYDYIVVGSGAGGGPLAARLARGGYKVLLLDAGDDQGDAPEQMIPAMQLQSTEFEPMRWDYFVNHYENITRQEEDPKMVYRTPAGELHKGPGAPDGSDPLGILYPRAGTLGGCTAHNAMITIYPYERDWDDLAAMTGNDSWAADNMRDYFRRLESNRYAPSDIISHGFSGWLQTSLTQLTLVIEDLKLLSLIIAAGTAMGQNLVGKVVNTVTGLAGILLRDLNTGMPWRDQDEGLFQVPLAVKVPDYKRTGPRDFLLDTVDDGYHLDIQLTTLGKSLYRADPRAGSAAAGKPGSVYAAKEVILSTGTFNTPQILKLSGIGPKDELDKWNITTLVDLPGLGKNMQDRYETTLIGKSPTDFVLTSKCTFLGSLPDPCYEDWKNGVLFKGTYMTNGIAIAILKSLQDAQHWAWIVLKTRARNNAGTVELRSTDPRDTPVINFHSFDEGATADSADEKDLQAVYEAMEFSREVFDNLIPLDNGFDETWPGLNVSTEAEMKEFIKREAWGHHACCTAPIGADEDPMSVLDGDFRVRGVDGLRVVDASVFPKIPGYYVVLPIYRISEKASDVILADAGIW
ncbi:hypothetical protein BDV12DRAFT_208365 [Aspergillus spectabilis]